MREREGWHRPVSSRFKPVWGELPPELAGTEYSFPCWVELGLRLLERIAPQEPAEGAYTLLSGYPFARAAGLILTEADQTALAAARHLLWTIRRRRTWHQVLDTYRLLPERVRGYDAPPGEPPRRLTPTIAADRFELYDATLAVLPPYRRDPLQPAPAGRSTFVERRRAVSVKIPEELTFPSAPGHDLLAGRPGDGGPLTVTWRELADTARWMDEREQEDGGGSPGCWQDRMAELRIATRDADGRGFTETREFTLDGLLHMVGMVGAGKSTLMTVVAVWAALRDRPLRTTLVVGDVAEQLRLLTLFDDLDVPAAPVLGASTREGHVQRLHRRLAAQGRDNLLDHDDRRFDELSTVCVVDALRGTEAAQPLRYPDAPCTALYPEPKQAPEQTTPIDLPPPRYRPGGDPASSRQERPPTLDDVRGEAYGCPIWSKCPRHRSARNLVDALVWIANPASLVQSAVPRHLNEERLRHLELACKLSDIVFVDEADSVQMRFDDIFAPALPLVQPGPDSWLDELQTHKIGELSRSGRLQLADSEIERWNTSLAVVSAATDKLYRILISDEDLRRWVDINYFSSWTLQEKLLADWFCKEDVPDAFDGVPDESALFEAYENDEPEPGPASVAAEARRAELTTLFDIFRDDPLGGRGRYGTDADGLIDLARELLHSDAAADTRKRVRELLRKLLKGTPAAENDDAWIELTCRRLEFTLLLATLDKRLNRLAYLWPQVEAALRLDATGNELSRRPPRDYAPIIPESPMGNVLGFQFLPDDRERDEDGRQSGTLRFFRCAGVGRELLLALNRLGADPGTGTPGPHVVLMSGTSWSGNSTRAHVNVPVGAVLMPSEAALEAVRRTRFDTFFLYDDDGKAMSVSGVPFKSRPAAVRSLAQRLGAPGRGGSASPLEQELARIADGDRHRALLLVGSYKEAALVAEVLHGMDRWHGRVRALVSDDAELGRDGAGPRLDGDEPVGVLRRGDLATFADDPEPQILVAPLMAVERGHNILNSDHRAAFGTALFLVRPHPRPDDLSLAVFAVNDWAVRFTRDQARADDRSGPATFGELVAKAGDLDRAGLDFRHEAREEWRRLLSRRYIYSRLSEWEKRSFTWDQLVTMWQVIGRLVRGGVPARVVFVDARFAPRTAHALAPGTATGAPPPRDGLLAGLLDALTPYFDDAAAPETFADPADPALARLLYQPLYDALRTLTHRF